MNRRGLWSHQRLRTWSHSQMSTKTPKKGGGWKACYEAVSEDHVCAWGGSTRSQGKPQRDICQHADAQVEPGRWYRRCLHARTLAGLPNSEDWSSGYRSNAHNQGGLRDQRNMLKKYILFTETKRHEKLLGRHFEILIHTFFSFFLLVLSPFRWIISGPGSCSQIRRANKELNIPWYDCVVFLVAWSM